MPDHETETETETEAPDGGTIRRFPRRRFLRDAAVATGGAVALGVAASAPAVAAQGTATAAPSAAAGGYTPVALTPEELTTLQAVVDRLIPPDEGPGAVQAGVPVYIDRSLAGAYASALPLYQQNLAALNAAALASGAGVFAALSSDDQDALLEQLEAFGQQQSATATTPVASNAPQVKVPPKLTGASVGFFPLLLEHAREGMFGDPMYGGNVNFAGWDLLGYPGIKLVWTAPEQALDTVVKPAHVSDAKYGGEPAR